MAAASQTILGVDYGQKQIGLALLSRPLDIATPLTVIRSRNRKPDWQALEAIFLEWRPNICVVGLALNMDGTESDLSAQCRRFARQLEGRLGQAHDFSIQLQDERLSSVEAKELLAESNTRTDYNARPADSLAAKVILESWLGEQTQGTQVP